MAEDESDLSQKKESRLSWGYMIVSGLIGFAFAVAAGIVTPFLLTRSWILSTAYRLRPCH